VRGTNRLILLHIDNEWFEALKILYSQATKSGTYTLIDSLIREGGSAFWGLKMLVETGSPSNL
jgi:hypothetical protein